MKNKIKKLLTIFLISALFTNQILVTTYASDTSIGDETEVAYSDEDLRLMSAIIFCEAGNQCLAGMEAVGIVVMNRVESDLFPNTISDVIYQKKQFTPASSGFLRKALKMYDKDEIPNECIMAAEAALNGDNYVIYEEEILDLGDCLFFSRYVKNCKVEIQDHDFK